MANATARGYRCGYVIEVTPGTTPASALQLLRTTSAGGRPNYQAIESEESHLTETPDVVRVGVDASGEINGEYSYGAFHGLLPSLFGANWATNNLKVGTSTITATIEDQYTDITKFMPWKGCLVNSFRVNMQQRQKITYTIGYKPTVIPTAMASATAGSGAATAAPTNPIMSPVASIQLLQEGGSGALKLHTFTMELTRVLIEQPILGSLSLDGIDPGSFSARGTAGMYLPNSTLADKLMADTETSLALTLGGASDLKDAWLFSKVRLTGGGIQPVGRNGAVILSIDWQAIYDATNSTVMLTRTPAA